MSPRHRCSQTNKQTEESRPFTCLAWNARDSAIQVTVHNNLRLVSGTRNLQNIITPIMREMDRSSENLQKECDQDTLHWSMRPAQCSDLQSTRKLGSPAMYSQHINFKKLARSAMRRRRIKCKKAARFTCSTLCYCCKVAKKNGKLVCYLPGQKRRSRKLDNEWNINRRNP